MQKIYQKSRVSGFFYWLSFRSFSVNWIKVGDFPLLLHPLNILNMANHINFYSEDIIFRMREIRAKKAWIIDCIESEDKKPGDISFIFCSDEYLHKMNIEYLSHDTLTDVITFDYTEDELISGDIFISIPRVKENAALYSKGFAEELNRVVIHGVLHLCGYKDKTSKDQKLMRQKENEKLLLLELPNR